MDGETPGRAGKEEVLESETPAGIGARVWAGDGDLGVGVWYSVCGVRMPHGWGRGWSPGEGPAGSRESFCLPGRGPGLAGKRDPGWGWEDAGQKGTLLGS